MPDTFIAPVLVDPPAGDLRRFLALRRAFPVTAEISTNQLADLWRCHHLVAATLVARFHRLGMADVQRLSSSTFLVLPRLKTDT